MAPPPGADGPPLVEFDAVRKRFGATAAVDGISFQVRRGEFFSLLGPSGCGKTTTLRLLAGLELPDPGGGEIRIGGERVNERRPYERRLGMVFQNYALFPHLTARRNVAFGLERRALPAALVARRVDAALALVRLDPARHGPRRPAELSGGERQRVALARALVLEPEILLLDEPLGAIDLQLRRAMQEELRALNRTLGITFVHVTHDQEEALAMSDRLAVMRGGRIAQLGTPAELYEAPRTAFVAGFIGEANLLAGRVAARDGVPEVVLAGGGRFRPAPGADPPDGGEATVAVRPERMGLHPPGAAPAGHNALDGTVTAVTYQGGTVRVAVQGAGGVACAVSLRNEGQLARPVPWRPGDRVTVGWPPEAGRLLEAE